MTSPNFNWEVEIEGRGVGGADAKEVHTQEMSPPINCW